MEVDAYIKRLKEEYREYMERLSKLPGEVIIDNAKEIACYQYILEAVQNEDFCFECYAVFGNIKL